MNKLTATPKHSGNGGGMNAQASQPRVGPTVPLLSRDTEKCEPTPKGNCEQKSRRNELGDVRQ